MSLHLTRFHPFKCSLKQKAEKRASLLISTFQNHWRKAVKTHWPWERVRLLAFKWITPSLRRSPIKCVVFLCIWTPHAYRKENIVRWILFVSICIFQIRIDANKKNLFYYKMGLYSSSSWTWTCIKIAYRASLQIAGPHYQSFWFCMSLSRVQECSFLTIPSWFWGPYFEK